MAKRKGTRPKPKPEEKATDRMDFDELYAAHNRLCSKEVPECRKTFTENEFRGDVLSLIAEKESKAVSTPPKEEAASVSA